MEEMDVFRFIVNGKEVETKEDKPLLRFLRDDLKCKSVKDGCSEGKSSESKLKNILVFA